ncbi:MAG TPA: MFS transporter [Bryobacteraceae bacterium]|nr:MFS transporter [Bryobacteraceae bacterium]
MASEASALQVKIAPERSTLARNGFLALILFSVAHFCVDLYSAALSAYQPVLGDKMGLSLTRAGILGGMMVFSGSVLQPAYGYLSDRFHSRLFSALGPAVAGIFISALCLAPSFGWLLLLILLGGAGIASFHPQASALATAGIVTSNRGRWMAIFISAGTLGLAVGPSFFTTLFTEVGLSRAWLGAIPGVFISIFLLFKLGDATKTSAHPRRSFDWRPLRAVWKPLTILYLLVFIRSILQVVYGQLLPLYLHRERGFSLTAASLALSLYLVFGAVGGFAGGHLADRFGGRQVILVSMAGCLPFLTLFFATSGVASIIGLSLGGLLLLFTIPVNVVMAQDLVPSQAGTVSALMMGFAWGTAGLIFIPLTGWAGDHFTLHHALSALLVFPIAGIALALKLDAR